MAAFASTFGRCIGSPNYNPCANFVFQDSCIYTSDLQNLAAHLGHNAQVSKSTAGIGAITKLVIDPTAPSGSAAVDVRLEGLRNRSVLAVVLRPAAGKLEFAEWAPRPEHAATAFVFAGVDEEGPRLALLVLDVAPDASGVVELGRLVFVAPVGGVTAQDLAISFEDMAPYTTAIESVAGQTMPALAAPARTALAQNIPNPFNPRTTIRYTVAGDSPVQLTIYNVAGKVVRTLVDRHQLPGEYAAVWDGRDESGQDAASGIYLYRLTTSDVTDTKKLVLLR